MATTAATPSATYKIAADDPDRAWRAMRLNRAALTKPLYERVPGSHMLGCVLCDKQLRDHPFGRTSHGNKHVLEHRAMRSPGGNWFVVPSDDEIVGAERQGERMRELRAKLQPLAKSASEAQDETEVRERTFLRIARDPERPTVELQVHRDALLAADAIYRQRKDLVEALLEEYDDVRDRITMGELTGLSTEERDA